MIIFRWRRLVITALVALTSPARCNSLRGSRTSRRSKAARAEAPQACRHAGDNAVGLA